MKIEAIWQPENQQGIFRSLMEAMARPGTLHNIKVWLDGTPAWRGVLASLLDTRTTLADCHQLLDSRDWPLLQASSESADKADYCLCRGTSQLTAMPKNGSLASPDHSATLIIAIDSLGTGHNALQLTGPGIAATSVLQLQGLDQSWLDLRVKQLSFPLGIDMILVDSVNLAAIPRTTQLEVVS